MRALLILPVLCLLGCTPRLAEGTHLIESGKPQSLATGESLRVQKRSPDLLTFVEVIEDSRCPRGVNCIQAGRAVVAVLVLRGGRFQRETVTLGDDGLLTDSGELNFLSLEPYPDAGVDEPEPYRLVVSLDPEE